MPENRRLGTIKVNRVSSYGELDDTVPCCWHTERCWVLYLPGCGIGELSNHTVLENADGSITVSPSIKMQGHHDGVPTEVHGHITNGVWADA